MRDIPIAYVGIDFLESFITEAKKSHLELSSQISKNINFIKFLFENYLIEFEIEIDRLKRIIEIPFDDISTFNQLAIDLNLDIHLLLFIRNSYQINPGRFTSVANKLHNMKQMANNLTELPNCVMIKCDNIFQKKFELFYSLPCFTANLGFAENYYTIVANGINKGDNALLNFSNLQLLSSKYVKFSDPYIFSNDAEGNELLDFLNVIFNNRINDYNFCLIEYSDEKGKFKQNTFEIKFKKLFPNTILKFSKRAALNLHDRNIFTNNYMISADAGFKKKYDKTTKWIIYPTICKYNFQKNLTKKYESEFADMINY